MDDNEELSGITEDILTNFDYYFNNYKQGSFSPEKHLMMSVLIYGIIDYLSTNRKDYFRDARKWFYNKEDTNYIYSFNNICVNMGVNPSEFRSKLQGLKRKKIKFALDGKRIAN